MNITLFAIKARSIIPMLMSLFITTTAWAQSGGGTEKGGLLEGTLKSQRISGGVSLLKNGASGLGFYSVNATTTIAANTAYASKAQIILINLNSLDEASSAIDEVQRYSPDVQRIYDLQGRRLQHGQHGVYIIRHTDGRSEKVIK